MEAIKIKAGISSDTHTAWRKEQMVLLTYEITETLMNVEDEEVKMYGIRVTQSETGVTYTSEVRNITSIKDKIIKLVKTVADKRITFEHLKDEVEDFIAADSTL